MTPYQRLEQVRDRWTTSHGREPDYFTVPERVMRELMDGAVAGTQDVAVAVAFDGVPVFSGETYGAGWLL